MTALASSTPERLQVVVVDDAVVARRVVARVLEQDPRFVVAGTAPDAATAIRKIAALRPDVVVLDLELPDGDGLAVLQTLREQHPDLGVVVFSHLATEGSATRRRALDLGAAACLAKPLASGIGIGMNELARALVPAVLAAGRRPSLAGAASSKPLSPAVVIASSTGGPNALARVIGALPARLDAAVLIAQHMPPPFTAMLAQRLDRMTELSVAEVANGDKVLPGHVYVAKASHHLAVRHSDADGGPFVVLDDSPPVHSCRPAADVLFRSAAEVWGSRLVGVVLTGMGRDGVRGSEAVRAAGGRVFVQDEATSVVWGMPRLVAEAGLADAVLPLDDLGAAIAEAIGGLGHD